MSKVKSTGSALASALAAVFGKNVEVLGVKMFLDTGFKPLNKALSGNYDDGLPVGRIVEIFGKESSGKTAIATNAMISAQKAGGVAMFLDHERSFMPKLGEQMGLCIDPAVGNFVHAVPRTFEESMDKMTEYVKLVRENELIEPSAPIIAVFDSLAAMVPKSKLAKAAQEQGMHDSLALAKACSTCFPVLQMIADEFNVCIVFLNQTRTNPQIMMGDSTTTPGGDAKNFYYSIRVALTRKMEKDKEKNVTGQTIKAKVIKNKVSAPFKEATWRFNFREDGTGYLDVLGASVDYLIEKNVLKQRGAYVELNGKKYFRSKLVEVIIENKMEKVIIDMINEKTIAEAAQTEVAED